MTIQTNLNEQIANWSVHYTKLHRFHWYVKGPAFFTLHAKFEELYNAAALTVDQIAERLLGNRRGPNCYYERILRNSNDSGNCQ